MVLAVKTALLAALVAWAASGFPPTGRGSDGARAQAAAIAVPRAHTRTFDGPRAFALLREQVRRYGWRPAGSPALARLRPRLRALLPRGRYEPVDGQRALRNVVGTIPGRRPAILVGAHYDVEEAPRGFVGANDGAAGTAAVVYLARALARAPRPKGAREVRFVLFDGEEEPAGCQPFYACGVRGSKSYASRHADELSSMVLLDYIAEKRNLRFARDGGSDRRLWGRLLAAARAVGTGSLFSAAATGEVLDDHTPFARRGVAAIDLIDFDYPPRDTLRDTVQEVSERSLDAVGETVYRLVDTLRRR